LYIFYSTVVEDYFYSLALDSVGSWKLLDNWPRYYFQVVLLND